MKYLILALSILISGCSTTQYRTQSEVDTFDMGCRYAVNKYLQYTAYWNRTDYDLYNDLKSYCQSARKCMDYSFIYDPACTHEFPKQDRL